MTIFATQSSFAGSLWEQLSRNSAGSIDQVTGKQNNVRFIDRWFGNPENMWLNPWDFKRIKLNYEFEFYYVDPEDWELSIMPSVVEDIIQAIQIADIPITDSKLESRYFDLLY